MKAAVATKEKKIYAVSQKEKVARGAKNLSHKGLHDKMN